jgi:hypothetical protein
VARTSSALLPVTGKRHLHVPQARLGQCVTCINLDFRDHQLCTLLAGCVIQGLRAMCTLAWPPPLPNIPLSQQALHGGIPRMCCAPVQWLLRHGNVGRVLSAWHDIHWERERHLSHILVQVPMIHNKHSQDSYQKTRHSWPFNMQCADLSQHIINIWWCLLDRLDLKLLPATERVCLGNHVQ